MKPTLHPPGDLGEAFRLHRADLVRLAAFIVGDRGTGEDVVQDVFARVHQRGRAPWAVTCCPTCAPRWSTAAVTRCGGGC